MHLPHRPPPRSQGFTLVDSLIAFFVFSVGLLGIAALELVSKRSSYEAVQRTTATTLAYDITERMRANPAEAVTGAYFNTVTAAPAADCSTAVCTAPELALYDRWQWQQALAGATDQAGASNVGGLVSPSACVARTAGGTANEITVAIAWRGQGAFINPTTHACGQGSGSYGANDEYRRVLVMNTFVAN